ncbi:MAG: SPASM domain-containing protein [Clostridiales bacterium]|jgi:radical SAM protein with 4Fe4S-binding SPASM domain|nr:SPASM domain-containing protein [Clostridiales bacterium]
MNSNLNKLILFGAGQIGCDALAFFGLEKVDYFADNNVKLQGTDYCGKRVIDINEVKELVCYGYTVVVSVLDYGAIVNQLKKEGIENYLIYKDIAAKAYTHIPFKSPKAPLVNYSAFHSPGDELNFAQKRKENFTDNQENLIRTYVNSVKDNVPLFQYIEVETVNRCNGTCSFCPVNARVDKRAYKKMSVELFKSIVDQLSELNYSGYFSPFSNNEPLLDKRLEQFLSYAREKLPNAWLYFYTNGTLLTAQRLKQIIDNVNEIIIDNYCTDGELTEQCKIIVRELEEHPKWIGKVHIDIRNSEEILLTRGGTSPNRSIMIDYGEFSCAYPFTQMVVRPDGKVSLCCNDALGNYTLGDLTKQSITDVWYSDTYKNLRTAIAKGRKYYRNCSKCDSMEARF